jgi:diaminohydroxyphosphoribosylaminopyrimidine deaminase/5-amino-6-(5-phosphoribosylamino)uracil reductase
LVGTNTAISDTPKLDVRRWGGEAPVRIVLDQTLRIPSASPLFDRNIKTIVCTGFSELEKTKSKENLIFEGIDFSKKVASQICEVLMKYNIQSILIEGGCQTLQTFIDAGLWDEARVLFGDVTFGAGVKAPLFSEVSVGDKYLKGTKLRTYKNSSQQF